MVAFPLLILMLIPVAIFAIRASREGEDRPAENYDAIAAGRHDGKSGLSGEDVSTERGDRKSAGSDEGVSAIRDDRGPDGYVNGQWRVTDTGTGGLAATGRGGFVLTGRGDGKAPFLYVQLESKEPLTEHRLRKFIVVDSKGEECGELYSGISKGTEASLTYEGGWSTVEGLHLKNGDHQMPLDISPSE
jgi:hypothetical protein